MDNEKVKEIPYMDKSYNEKRKILRRQHFISKDIFELTNQVLYKVLKKIKPNKFVDYKEVIKHILVDGYVAYEKIYDDNDKVIALNPIDPISLVLSVEKDGQILWHQNKGTPFARILYDSQVLYVKSGLESYTSLVELCYIKMIDKDSKYSLKYCVDSVVDSYNESFLKIK